MAQSSRTCNMVVSYIYELILPDKVMLFLQWNSGEKGRDYGIN